MTKFTDSVKKPYVYSGGEYGLAPKKNAELRFCMCMPDSYEVGMSNLGLRILYYTINSLPNVFCDRCFAPWQDYADWLTKSGRTLSGLESGVPLKDFDFLGFSMQFELCYSNFFYMLSLSGIPFESELRGEQFPFVAAGGPCAVNLEPLYKYFDFIFVGEGETPWKNILSDYLAMGKPKKSEFLAYLHENYPMIYVPSLQGIEYECGKVVSIGAKKVVRNIEKSLEEAYDAGLQMVPNVEIVHDRAVLELFRGCAGGCRFCQAGFIYRPVRERSVDNAFESCKALLNSTGYDEISLNSLSTGDYGGLSQLLDKLLPYAAENNVSLNLPSLRMDSFRGDYVSGNRKSSLTFAPEAGTQRLRDVINKNVSDEDVYSTVEAAFKQGYFSVKLYFMLGLPTETDKDVEAIADMAQRIKSIYRASRISQKPLRIAVSCGTFIPKPFTPFQWEKFADREQISAKQKYLSERFRAAGVAFSYNDYDTSFLEAVLARGDRTLADALQLAYQSGARFDAWSEYLNFGYYRDAFEKCGVDVQKIVGERKPDVLLPWDYVDVGVKKEFLLSERNLAYLGQTTPSCNVKCNACGLNEKGWCKLTHGNTPYKRQK